MIGRPFIFAISFALQILSAHAADSLDVSVEMHRHIRGLEGLNNCYLVFNKGTPPIAKARSLLDQAMRFCISVDSSTDIMAAATTREDEEVDGVTTLMFDHKSKRVQPFLPKWDEKEVKRIDR